MSEGKSKSFVSNVIIILSAQITVKILGMFYRMVITNIKGFGDAGNGYYSAGFQVYTLLLALSSVGIPNAISKLISEKTAVSDYGGAKKLFKTALLIFSSAGIILSMGLFFSSAWIAEDILDMEGAKYTLAALSPSIFFVCVSSVFRGMPIECAVVSTSAGLLGMLPKGLVLLISIGFAAGVINLSKKQVLVRELHSLENLAHCDTVCLDKTGTLTEGKLSVEKVFADIDDKEFEKLIASYVKYTDDNNSTYKALETRFKCLDTYNCISGVPFSSERKYSSVTLENGQTFVIGAPEKLCKAVPKSASDLMAEGRRVINNLTKSAGVFFIKTIYSVLLCIFCLLFNVSFPFIPIQITLIDAVIEAFPAFFMSFEKNDKKCEESFLQTTVKAALLNGVSVFACCAVIIMLSGYLKIEASQSSLLMYISVGFISLAGVIKASLPFNPLRGFLAAASVFGFLCAVALFSGVLQLPHLSFMGAAILPFIMIMGLIPAVCIRV